MRFKAKLPVLVERGLIEENHPLLYTWSGHPNEFPDMPMVVYIGFLLAHNDLDIR